MEHYPLCASIYICITLHYAPDGLSTGILPISVSAQFMSCSSGDNQEARGILATVCAYSFYVCRIQISQVCIIKLCGPISQICIPAFSLQFMCITFYESNQIVIIHSSRIVNILSVSIFFNSGSVILSSLLLVELCSSSCTLHHSRS